MVGAKAHGRNEPPCTKEENTMKYTPEPALEDKTDIKVFLLYLLSGTSQPLDYQTIHDMACGGGLVHAFDFAECFDELVELGHVLSDEVDGERFYVIAQSGREVAAELQSGISETVRTQSAVAAAKLLSLRRRGARVGCSVTLRDDKRYEVTCRITESSGELLQVRATVTTQAEAEQIKHNFEKKPDAVFRGVLAVLAGEVDYLLN